ncbi:pilus assembly protein CpaF [Ruminiclostridium sufflavum DSM 19573]|uniref:Pilus assembly protein CpaF n=1 Tax=Ruminiclostridium sufflavum DSM 19573 TaxID=1121337 RepID=A0A318XRY2_9FIRM|nr:ATPase [Ruminiclostridium sufflavum]PYG84320.1 pilus assembly protein CpaF [Ruminiclostridium sufflavum DSM 19573]
MHTKNVETKGALPYKTMTDPLDEEIKNRRSKVDYSKMKEFDLEELLGNSQKNRKKHYSYGALDNNSRFLLLCSKIKKHIDEEWLKEQNSNNTELLMERHKNAILGKPTEVNYLKDKIRDYLKANKLEKEQYPSWYKNLTDAVFHENWGIAGIAQWMDLPDSSSAKIIGDRIYFLIGGKQVLKEQRISSKRFEQLRQALMLRDETKRLDENYSELYMETGERVTVYTGKRVAEGQSAMVFRKYIVDVLTFEEQARRGTIPGEFIPAMEALVKCGVRVAFTGPVRSGKSTMLLTWQLYENPELEGVLIQTDPEIRIQEVMPKAPIMSLIAEGEGLFKISSEILKSDADYLIVQEVRDGYTAYIAVEAGNKGTNRLKITSHLSNVEDFCYDLANKIIGVYGGSLDYHMVRVANSFNLIFEMVQIPGDRSQKRLKSVSEIQFDNETSEITYHRICEYKKETDSWCFNYSIGKRLEEIAGFENPEAFEAYKKILKALSEKYPMPDKIVKPVYSKIRSEI